MTEYLADRVLVLPTGLHVDEPSIVRIADIVRTAVDNALAVRGRLRQRGPLSPSVQALEDPATQRLTSAATIQVTRRSLW